MTPFCFEMGFKKLMEKLTPREKQICEVMLNQPRLTLRGVGERVGIGHDTVNFHLKNVYAKLQVQCRSELIKNLCDGEKK